MRKWLLPICMIFLANVLSGCSSAPSKTSETAAELPTVMVETVNKQSLSKTTELSGILAASKETLLSFEIPGRIVLLEKKEGDAFRKGELLATLDPENYKLGLEASDANVLQADAGLKQTVKGAREQEIKQVELTVDKAKAGYQKTFDDFNRIKQLYKEGAVPESTYEAAEIGLKVAKKDLQLAQESYSLIVEGATAEVRDRARAVYDLAKISKEQAALSLNKTNLLANENGTIISKLFAEGQLTAAGVPIYKIGNVDTLKALLPVPDREIKEWKKGDRIQLTLYGERRDAVVKTIFPSTNQSTGTISVEVAVTNPRHDWFIGQVVTATRRVKSKENVYVPAEAVISRGGKDTYVFRSINHKAVKTNVQVGELFDNRLEILYGLKEGDTIIAKGADRLYDGEAIREVRGK